MKTKRIAIIYNPNRIDSISSAEKVFHNIVNNLKNEGNKVSISNEKAVIFKNGTKVEKISFGKDVLNKKVTHMYVDSNIMELEGGKNFLFEALIPCVISNRNYVNLDVAGEREDRVFIFNQKGIIEKLKNND